MVKQPAQLIRFAGRTKAMVKSVLLIMLVLLKTTSFAQKNNFVLIQFNSNNHFFINKDTIPKTEKKDDAFSRLMAGVVNDTAILYNSYVDVVPKKDTVKLEAVKKADNKMVLAPKKDSVKMEIAKKPVTKVDSSFASVEKKDSLKSEVVKKPVEKIDTPVAVLVQKKISTDSVKNETAVINKIEQKKDFLQMQKQTVFAEKMFEEKTDSSLQLIYASFNKEGKRDTVYMSIPTEKIVMNKSQTDSINKIAETISPKKDTINKLAETTIPKKDTVREFPKDTAVAIVKTEEKKITIPLITSKVDSINNIKKDTASTETKASPKIFVGNTNCKNLASDYDVDKLRVKMLAAENEDDKIFTARKFFRLKCYSTNQIKALSEVFSTDEGRYKLFDTAYPFVSDYGNYPQLSTLLTSQYYINRFSAMIKQ